jgi:hypothetical protein
MEKLTPEARIARSEAFKRLWAEYEFDGLFEELENQYVKEWRKSEIHETKKRDDLWRACQVVGHVRQHLISIVSDGASAKIELRGKSNAK